MLTATIFSNLLDNKVRELYGSIESVKDILKISEPLHFTVGNGGGALNIPLRGKSADIIGEILEGKGWVKTKIGNDKNIKTFTSPDGLEAVNIRGFSTSADAFLENGYIVEKTIDLLKKKEFGNGFEAIDGKSEIKFLKAN